VPETVDPQVEALQEQIAYYRARAGEYDQWFLRLGRYNRGEEHLQQWISEVQQVVNELESFQPLGEVLEFAGGTGLWTEWLAKLGNRVLVVDAAPEMIEQNRLRTGDLPVTYQLHDIFSFRPDRQYDFVFFGFWLSHVPSKLFSSFWALVRDCLKPEGRFFFIDSIKEPQSTAVDHVLHLEDDKETLIRRLNDGREFQIYKLFYHAEELQSKLEAEGFKADVKETPTFFLYGSGHLAGR